MRLYALFRLAFATASGVTPLTLPQRLTRRLILQKARRQSPTRVAPLRPVVSIRFQILFPSPCRGSFHLSLTVLVHYRSSDVFSLGRWTSQLPTELACSVVLRIPPLRFAFVYGTLTLSGAASQPLPLRLHFAPGVLQPRRTRSSVWAAPLSLATTRRIFSFPRVT